MDECVNSSYVKNNIDFNKVSEKLYIWQKPCIQNTERTLKTTNKKTNQFYNWQNFWIYTPKSLNL